MHGAVLGMSGDIPASNFIGGFKEGVGLSLRKCRMCMATATDMDTKVIYPFVSLSGCQQHCTFQFHAADFIARTKTSHLKQLSLLEESRKHSVTYGINYASPLLQINNFDITCCLPFDAMHTIFEGVAINHLNQLFRHLIDTCGYFSIGELNHIIKTHLYGYSEADTKPTPIYRETATSPFKIKLSGIIIIIFYKIIVPLLQLHR